jgi:hypothetical protein
MAAEITGLTLVPDGDLLAYDKDGDPQDVDTNSLNALIAFGAAHDVSERTVRRDVKKEKEQSFENTETYKALRNVWQAKHGRPAPYARIPDVALRSPKLSKPRTTAWFAQSVKKRYDACRARPL